jgi:hypothetical protein
LNAVQKESNGSAKGRTIESGVGLSQNEQKGSRYLVAVAPMRGDDGSQVERGHGGLSQRCATVGIQQDFRGFPPEKTWFFGDNDSLKVSQSVAQIVAALQLFSRRIVGLPAV